jgi:hypothetical protein
LAPETGSGFGGGVTLIGITFEYPNACAISAGSTPLKRIEKKLRKANEIRFKC